MKPQNIGVLTSGGDSPGMNAAIRSVVRSCAYHEVRCTGIYEGFQGMIDGNMKEFTARDVKNILGRGGTILRSARCEAFRTKEGRDLAFQNLQNNHVDGLVVIGGDGSFTGADIFSHEFNIPVTGIPGTIDNDLWGTEYTLGYDTATNTVVDCVDKLRDTATSHNRLFFVEVMGRDTGFIALRTGVATGALDVVLPEEDASFEDLVDALQRGASHKKTSNIVIIAEGNGIGSAHEIADKVKKIFPEIETRVTVLGHLQRGGAPSCRDRILAAELGVAAVEALLEGKTRVMAGSMGNRPNLVPFSEAIGKQKHLDPNLLRVSRILSI
ncbi:MAG: 6-phosphofructokinase [Bacteroidota bacterium]|nr:6-phosphofructokinase [Bacteroidota bacterium]